MSLFKHTTENRTISVSGAEAEARYAKDDAWQLVTEKPAPKGDGAAFDPAEHSVAEVATYLDGLDGPDPHRAPCVDGSVCGDPAHCPPSEARTAEIARVLEAERGGKNRSTIVGAPANPPA